MPKVTVSIPVVVTKSGALMTGTFWSNDQGTGEDTEFCYDGLPQKDYESGTTVVHIEAEFDIEQLFKSHTVQGKVVE